MRHFPASQLPSTPADRFATLFATQPRWTREQLDPYLAGLKVRGVLHVRPVHCQQASSPTTVLLSVACRCRATLWRCCC